MYFGANKSVSLGGLSDISQEDLSYHLSRMTILSGEYDASKVRQLNLNDLKSVSGRFIARFSELWQRSISYKDVLPLNRVLPNDFDPPEIALHKRPGFDQEREIPFYRRKSDGAWFYLAGSEEHGGATYYMFVQVICASYAGMGSAGGLVTGSTIGDKTNPVAMMQNEKRLIEIYPDYKQRTALDPKPDTLVNSAPDGKLFSPYAMRPGWTWGNTYYGYAIAAGNNGGVSPGDPVIFKSGKKLYCPIKITINNNKDEVMPNEQSCNCYETTRKMTYYLTPICSGGNCQAIQIKRAKKVCDVKGQKPKTYWDCNEIEQIKGRLNKSK